LYEVVRKGVIHNDLFYINATKDYLRNDGVLRNSDWWRRCTVTPESMPNDFVRNNNMLWNSERRRLMLISLERYYLIYDQSSRERKSDTQQELSPKRITDKPNSTKKHSLGKLQSNCQPRLRCVRADIAVT
jgi:hypothetical protein